MLNFYTFKWGSKYDARYPNRLYGSLTKWCKVPFTLTCITDDTTDILPQIETIDYNSFDLFDYPKDRVFTREKLCLMKKFNKGKNFWLDLDLLIHNDITDLVTRDLEKPTFIWNYWNWDRAEDPMEFYGHGQTCYINSSFVGWQDNNGEILFDELWKRQKEAFYTYASLDKYLFYQHWHKKNVLTWERGLWYNYNFGTDPFKAQEDKKGCIFNTSHLKLYDRDGVQRPLAFELHETRGWAKRIWESYDER